VNPTALLDRYCNKLHCSVGARAGASGAAATGFLPQGSVRAVASMLLELAEVEWLFEGRPAEGVVVGCILVALSSLGLRVRELSTQAVSDLVGVKLYTAKKRSAELKAVALGVAQALPGRGGLPEGVLLRSLPAALEQARLERAAAMVEHPEPLEKEAGEGVLGVEPDPLAGVPEGRDATRGGRAPEAALMRAGLGGGAMGTGAEVVAKGGSTRKAAGMRGPPAFLASLAKRQRLEMKLEAARQRVAAAPSSAAAGSGAEDEELRRVEEALRRGVPDEAIVLGYFDSVPLNQDREVSAANAPHLFEEGLCEDDLLNSTTGRLPRPAPIT
jgi:hypothetical protein